MTKRIEAIKARQIWDSRGWPTVEVDVALTGGAMGRAAAPAGASRGIHEAIDLRDGGERYCGRGVDNAIGNVNGEIADALIGQELDQANLDMLLTQLDGTKNFARLGGNAVAAVSLAIAHAGAAAEELPLWRFLSAGRVVRMPLPEIQIFGGGAHAGRRTDIQDFMIMVPSAQGMRQAFEITAAVYHAAGHLMAEQGRSAGTADEGGWWPNFTSNEDGLATLTRAIERAGYRPGADVFISLDIAASEFYNDGRYKLSLDGRTMDAGEMIDLVSQWCSRYPVLSIEDPVSQDDMAGMALATHRLGGRVQVVGDDFLVTDAARVTASQSAGACNALLVKVNQAGTVSRARAAFQAAQKGEWASVVSARSGETEDVSIAHLAVGWDAGQIKVGSFARSERMAKWNELLRIEEDLGCDAVFAGWDGLPRQVRR